MSDTIKVDQEWKEEAAKAKAKAEADSNDKKGQAYVSCAEVAQYLTELSNVLEQFTGGIRSSLEEMMARSTAPEEEGESNDGE